MPSDVAGQHPCPKCGGPVSSSEENCPACRPSLGEVSADSEELASTMVLPDRMRGRPTQSGDVPVPVFPQVGGYEIIGEIARGGMGVVYRARQKTVRRLVALKMILPHMIPNDEAIRRFRIEAEAVARLDHPNIVPFYEVGVHEGRAFFTMKLVEGGSLHQHTAALTADHRRAAQIMARVARAVDYAHQRGILHRDLKPGNILLDEAGQPHLTDFGLAKHANRESSLTESGAVIGTPSFMAPEQASGRAKQVTAAADIYGLGAIFYLLLTGRPPFQGEKVLEILRQVVDEEPERPSSINRSVDRDLEAIALKCLEKEPERRYASAGDLADDLESWLHQRPISARLATGFEHLVKWAKRKPVIATLTGALAVALVGGFAATFQQWREAEAARVVAVQKAADEAEARREAVAQRQRAEDALTRMELERVEDYFERDDSVKAIEGLIGILRRDPDNTIAGERLLSALVYRNFLQPETNEFRHERLVRSIQVHPDGRRVLTASFDGTVRVSWIDPAPDAMTFVLKHRGAVMDACFSGDGQWILSASQDRTARIWDANSGLPKGPSFSHSTPVMLAVFGGDGRHAATASMDGVVTVWDSLSGQRIISFPKADGPPAWIGFSPGGEVLATAFGNQMLLWDWREARLALPPLEHDGKVWTGDFSSDGRLLAVGSRAKGAVLVWSAEDGKPVSPVLRHYREVNSVRFSPNGQSLLTASVDGTARVWKTSDWQELFPPLRHNAEVKAAIYNNDGSLIATASIDGSARIWDARTGSPLTEPLLHSGAVELLDFSNVNQLLTGARDPAGDGVVQLWHLRSGPPGPPRLKHDANVLCAAFDQQGGCLATGDQEGILRLWDTSQNRLLHVFTNNMAVQNLHFSAATGLLSVHVADGRVRFFDTKHGNWTDGLITLQPGTETISFSKDGGIIAVQSGRHQAQIFDVKTRLILREVDSDLLPVSRLLLSSSGRFFAMTADKKVYVWPVNRHQLAPSTLVHSNRVFQVGFSHDESLVFTRDSTGCIRAWHHSDAKTIPLPSVFERCLAFEADPENTVLVAGTEEGWVEACHPVSGQILWSIPGRGVAVRKIAFAPGSRRICVSYVDGGLRLFDVATGLPVSERLQADTKASSLEFSPDGGSIVVLGEVADVPVFSVPRWTGPAMTSNILASVKRFVRREAPLGLPISVSPGSVSGRQ